jgi:hypothetical protein
MVTLRESIDTFGEHRGGDMAALLYSLAGFRRNRITTRGVVQRVVTLGAIAHLAVLLASSSARAQAIASPLASVSQRVDSTTITVEYYRPAARGRALFGKLVRWGELWTPGANWATTVEVDRDVRIEGQALPRGKYSMWMIPVAKPDAWTVVLSRSARRFHVVRPDARDEALRIRVSADSAPHLELLTFSFPAVSRTGATLAFQWGSMVVPMRMEIQSSRPAIAATHPWASYAGVYELRGAGGNARSPAIRYEIVERANGLWVRTTPDAVEPGLDAEFDLLPAGGDEFHPRQYKNGTLIGDEVDELIIFQVEGGRATGFEVRGIAEDKVLARGTRAPSPR